MKINDELIRKMELDPYDDWQIQLEEKTVNVSIEGIDQNVRDYFGYDVENYPDSWITSYAIINPQTREAIELYIHHNDDDANKAETIVVPKEFQKKIFDQLVDSANTELRKEFLDWIEEEANKNERMG